MNRKAIISGLTIVFVSNGLLLLRVAAERSGTPVQTLRLSGRELPMIPRGPEDSSVSLRLSWRPYFLGPRNPRPVVEKDVTFNEDKLRALGFRCGTPDSRSPFYRLPQHRMVYVVLQRSEETAVFATNKPGSGPDPNPSVPQPSPGGPPGDPASELVAADASASLAELRARYPDSRKYFIVRGVVGASSLDGNVAGTQPRWTGRVSDLLPGEIHVPLPHAGELNRLTGEKGNRPRYTVTVHYGPNLLPWIGGIRAEK